MRQHLGTALGALGGLLLVGIVMWQLLRTSYKRDIEMMCTAEQSSGASVKSEPDKVGSFVLSRLGTPEGNRLWHEMKEKPGERAKLLRDAQQMTEVSACPMLDAYENLRAEGEYRSDIGQLCNGVDLVDMEYSDEPTRNKKLAEWLATKPKSPRTKAFGEKLLAASPAERREILVKEGQANSAYICPMGERLAKAAIPRPAKGKPMITMQPPAVTGDLPLEKVAEAFAKGIPAMQKCYDASLARDPKIGGQVSARVKVEAGGKIVKAAATGLAPPAPELLACVQKILETAPIPSTNKTETNIIIVLSFIADADAPPDDGHGH